MFDFGLGIYSDLTLVNAAREGARLGVIDPGNTTAIEERVRAMAGNLDASRLNVEVVCERVSGSGFTACTNPMWLPGDATRVTVSLRLHGLLPAAVRHGDPALVRSEDADRVAALMTATDIDDEADRHAHARPGCPLAFRQWARTGLCPAAPSTLTPSRMRGCGISGQALVLFTLFFTVILGMAALVLDQRPSAQDEPRPPQRARLRRPRWCQPPQGRCRGSRAGRS